MATSRVSLPALVVTFIAALVALQNTQNFFGCMAGLTLLVTLFAYDRRGARTGWQSLAFAFVAGLALMLAILYPLRLLLAGFAVTNELPALVWLVGTATFWFIDRARMDARHAASFAGYSQPPVAQAVPSIYPPSSYSAPYPAPPPTAPAAPAPAPVPIPVQRTFTPAPEPQPYVEQVAPPVPTPEVEPVTSGVPPARAPIPRGQGKEVSIYLNLLGEGMNVLRAVRAEHLGRDYYIITEEMPEGESWEYAPGQVVRCRKKNLSSGKGLVAYEEAPRAQ
jgi:hypothetical protein